MEKIEFTPKQWVLVRDNEDGRWALAQFSNMWNDSYVVVGGIVWNHCIPYEGNEHLLGTTDDYVEPYKPKDGDFIAIKVYEKEIAGTNHWICIFKSISDSICAYAGLAIDGHLVNKGNGANYNKDWMEYARPATEEEKQLLLSKLAEQGKQWNAEKKCIEDIWTPKDGEFVTYTYPNGNSNSTYVAIAKDSYNRYYVSYQTRGTLNAILRYNLQFLKCYTERRPSTDSEKQQLLDAMHKAGKDWDAEKMEVVDYKWSPERLEEYHYCKFNDELNEF